MEKSLYRLEDIHLLGHRKINLFAFISKKFAFEEMERAYEYIEEYRDTVLKVLLYIKTRQSTIQL